MFRLPDIEKEGELEGRVDLVLRHGLYPKEKMYQCLNFIFGRVTPDEKTLKDIKEEFGPYKHGLDDIYRLKMLVAYMFIHEEQLDDNLIIQIPENEINLNFFGKALSKEGKTIPIRFSPKNRAKVLEALKRYAKKQGVTERKQSSSQKPLSAKEFMRQKRIRLKNHGYSIAKKILPKTKAQLALLEIFTLTSLDDFIPELLKNCPQYLFHCPVVKDKFLGWAYMAKMADDGKSNEEKYLKNVFAALKWKHTPSNKSYLDHWLIYQRKTLLEKHLTASKAMGIQQRKEYEGYIKHIFGLDEILWNAFVDYKKSPSGMALEIIREERLVESYTFKDIKGRIEKLLKKHPPDEIDLYTGRLTKTLLSQESFFPENPHFWSIFDHKHQERIKKIDQ